jgi:hypothetical protein
MGWMDKNGRSAERLTKRMDCSSCSRVGRSIASTAETSDKS